MSAARRAASASSDVPVGDDTAMTSASGPLYVRRAQVTCPICGTVLQVATSEQTTGDTVLSVALCPAEGCTFVMLGADLAVDWERDEAGPFEPYEFGPHDRVSLTLTRPEDFVTGSAGPVIP